MLTKHANSARVLMSLSIGILILANVMEWITVYECCVQSTLASPGM